MPRFHDEIKGGVKFFNLNFKLLQIKLIFFNDIGSDYYLLQAFM